MPMEDTYGIQSRIGSIIVVERWYCCRGSPVFSDRNIQFLNSSPIHIKRSRQYGSWQLLFAVISGKPVSGWKSS